MRSELEWVLRSLGPAAELVRVRRMHATEFVAMHAIDAHHRGVRRRLVLRRYINTDHVAEEPDIAEREARALELLANERLRTPRLVAVDPAGQELGCPGVLMTRLGGREEWCPPSIERLAAVAPLIHQVRAPRNFRRYYRYYTGEQLVPPVWSKQPKLWERAFEVAEAVNVDDAPSCFIHRDHHAGNVLWSYGRVNGVVDWEPACVGPPAVDFAHVRTNLAAWMGISAARRYAKCPDIEVDPVWDIVDTVDLGPDFPGPNNRRGREAFVADALSELG